MVKFPIIWLWKEGSLLFGQKPCHSAHFVLYRIVCVFDTTSWWMPKITLLQQFRRESKAAIKGVNLAKIHFMLHIWTIWSIIFPDMRCDQSTIQKFPKKNFFSCYWYKKKKKKKKSLQTLNKRRLGLMLLLIAQYYCIWFYLNTENNCIWTTIFLAEVNLVCDLKWRYT